MNEMKFYNVNKQEHTMLLVDGVPSPGDCLIVTLKENKTIYYKVIDSESLMDMELPYDEGLIEGEDIPMGIEEITAEEFVEFQVFTNKVDEFFIYSAETIS